MKKTPYLLIVSLACWAAACGSEDPVAAPSGGADSDEPGEDTGSEPGPDLDFDGWALGCYAVQSGDSALAADASGERFAFDSGDGARFFMQPSDLGTYLLYDQDKGYVVAEDGPLSRESSLQSDVTLIDDAYVSGAEWVLETSVVDPARYQLLHRRSGQWMGLDGLTSVASDAAPVQFSAAEGCAEHPELSLDASGSIAKTTFDDGDLYGIVDTHSHILSNFGFGGGMYHGGAFHRLGVEHALPDCALYHGEMGRKDFFGYAYDEAGNNTGGLIDMVAEMAAGEMTEDNHETAGYPEFTEWPDARERATHQTQYYRWLERAHLAGLRLVVQHATSNSVICNMMVGEGIQPSRYDCEDMTAVDRIIDETYQMERYIDARSGGAGEGWFRVVQTPAEARSVIESGKMAVILGIETSDLFDCHLSPRPDGPECDDAYINDQLDAYYARGVRALFPVHKYDNAFGPGDGSGDFIELGNFLNSGHWTNMTEDCPSDMPSGFDGGSITFGGLHSPREEFLSEAPNDLNDFPEDPLGTALSFVSEFLQPSIDGDWCQNATLTPQGETLMLGMMARGMIIEVDHFPKWSYQRAFEMLEEHDYPAAGTHGRHWDGKIYALGGTSMIGLGRCQDSENPGATLDGLRSEVELITEMGGYPAVGFGFDLNGFAGAPGPRFGEGRCSQTQGNPTVYPFTSYAGDVEFTQPYLGERVVDFDTEGFVHVGMLPELLRDAQADAQSDTDLEPLFRSAEAYIRMWEKAETRALEIAPTVGG